MPRCDSCGAQLSTRFDRASRDGGPYCSDCVSDADPDADADADADEQTAATGPETVLAAVLCAALIGSEAVVHELVHLAGNVLATGQVRSCGVFGPVALVDGRLGTCLVRGGFPAWNALVTPVLMGALGVVAIVESDRFGRRWQRWAVFVAGVYTWLCESLYSAGWLVPPTIASGRVEYWGDGTRALEAFGWPAQLPALLLVLAGVAALQARLQYRSRSDTPSSSRR